MRLNFATLSDPMQKAGGQGGTPGTVSIHTASSRPHLPENSGDVWGHAPAPVIERQANRPELSPMSPSRQQHWGHGKPCIHAVAPIVPNVPEERHMIEIDRSAFEERAVSIEVGSGVFRAEAERLTAHSLGIST